MLKLFAAVTFSLSLTLISNFLQANEDFVTNQQTELKSQKNNWELDNIPEGIQTSKPRISTTRDSGIDGVNLYAKNINFDVVDRIGFHIEELAATLVAKNTGEPVSFDDVESFTINIHHGKVLVSPEVLTLLFNKHILDYSPRPLNKLTISTEDNYLRAEGGLRLWSTLPGNDWLPAKLGGTVTLSEDNKIIYNIDEVKALGIPLAGLLKLLHVKLPWLLSLDREGAQLGSYELALDHRSVFPPPALAGNLSDVSVSPAGLHLTFSDNPDVQFDRAPVNKDSFLWIQSGDPKLYGIVALNAQVAIVSESVTTPLRFNLYNYRQQVAEGTIRVPNQDGTLIVTLPADTLGAIVPETEKICRNRAGFRAHCPESMCENSSGFKVHCDDVSNYRPRSVTPDPETICRNSVGFRIHCDDVKLSYADDKCKNSLGFNICK